MQQELAVHISYEFASSATDDSVFTGIIEGIKNSKISLNDGIANKEDKEERWNNLEVLENLFFVQGGTGSGKSSATAYLTYKMLKCDKNEVIVGEENELYTYK